jgi:hypothetical protein
MILQRVDMGNGNRVDVCTDAVHGYGIDSNIMLKKAIEFTHWEMDRETGFITMFANIQFQDKTIFIREHWWHLFPKPIKVPTLPVYVKIHESQIKFKDIFKREYIK